MNAYQFQAHPLLRNAHLQTIWGRLARTSPPISRTRERLPLPDGDFIDIDWHYPVVPVGSSRRGVTVALFHGLTGSSDSLYIRGLQISLGRIGITSAAINFRGCSGTPNLLPRGYHSGETEDMGFVLSLLKRRYPEDFIAAVGYSLGANALCKWLGEQGEQASIDAAVAISAPFNLAACASHMDRGPSRVYRNQLVSECLDYIFAKKRLFKLLASRTEASPTPSAAPSWSERFASLAELGSESSLRKIKSFWDFDERVTAPLNGFTSATDYYQKSSAMNYLPAVRKPLWIIHSLDDPFMPPNLLPSAADCPKDVSFSVGQHGGHVGFVSAAPDTGRMEWWLERAIPEWIATMSESRAELSIAVRGSAQWVRTDNRTTDTQRQRTI